MPMQIVYDKALANRMHDIMMGGGTIVTTTDLFLKNADNAYMQELPCSRRSQKIYVQTHIYMVKSPANKPWRICAQLE